MGPKRQVAGQFPQVLAKMSEKLDLTTKIGDAFLSQQKDVMETVQELRKKAHEAGNLKTTKEQKVVVEKETIVIKPADPPGRLCPHLQSHGRLWHLGISLLSPLLLLSATASILPGVSLCRGGRGRGRLGLCLGQLQLESRRGELQRKPERQRKSQYQPQSICQGKPGNLATQPAAPPECGLQEWSDCPEVWPVSRPGQRRREVAPPGATEVGRRRRCNPDHCRGSDR